MPKQSKLKTATNNLKPRIRIASNNSVYNETEQIVQKHSLNTICQEANCPNIQECWNKKHASFMILGSTCTRSCAFCNVATGIPDKVNSKEPLNVALAISKMGLNHVVITSVDRDDLPDGGAEHFAKTIQAIRGFCLETTIEVLTPDFLGKKNSIKVIINAQPDVFNHNIETVPSLYRRIRPKANYFNSLLLLKTVKQYNNNIFTKSGFMVGLGETDEEILQLMEDLRSAEVDFLTIGQYLQPTPNHAPVKRYVRNEEFEYYKERAYRKGFTMVSSSSLTRSSYHAGEDFKKLKQKRFSPNYSSNHQTDE